MTNRAIAKLPDMAQARNFSATEAKAKLGEVIDLVAAGGIATITRRGRQRFAVLRAETLEALLTMARDHELDSLAGRYDDLVAHMQTVESRAAADALFTADAKEVGAAFTQVTGQRA